jgi:enamine deaminase RidA (YjgF/YER057c/UK114 family)
VSVNEPILPEGWPRPSGYAEAIHARMGRVVALSGQVGWDPVTHGFASDDFVAQVRQALLNVRAVLEAAGCTILDVIRMTWYITDREAYLAGRRAIGEVWREVFGKHYPAMSVVVVAGLIEPRAKVEIETTAAVDD